MLCSEILLNLFLIALCCVIVIDVSGFVQEMEALLARWLKMKSVRIPKPFSCSFCMTHWIGLFYLLFGGHLTLAYYAVTLFMCVMTPIVGDVVWYVRDTLGVWAKCVYNFITGKIY